MAALPILAIAGGCMRAGAMATTKSVVFYTYTCSMQNISISKFGMDVQRINVTQFATNFLSVIN
jgi:hypothetical protein